ncbi:MAG: class I tRNA ligase family protein, partial [Verrucomicrobiota bacterium]
VWIDALINYLSTVDTPERSKYWPADVHLLAKDILWFHAVIWPAMLLALKRPLPAHVYAHGFWISEGQKMSKSLGNFIDLERIDRYVMDYGLDALRYYIASNGPLAANDSDFSEAKFIEVYNTDLANELGNLVNRALSMLNRYRQGVVPQTAAVDLRGEAEKTFTAYRTHMDKFDLTGALAEVRLFVIRANRYVEENAPWKLAKTPDQAPQLEAVLYNLCEAVRLISVALLPVMPTIAGQMRTQLGIGKLTGKLTEELAWGRLPAGTKIGTVAPLFPKKA